MTEQSLETDVSGRPPPLAEKLGAPDGGAAPRRAESTRLARPSPEWTWKALLGSNQGIVFLALCALVFAAGLSTPSTSMWNATILSGYEIAFILIYYLVLRRSRSPRDAGEAGMHPVILIVIGAWFVSIAISLFASPLGIAGTLPAQLRFEQTVSHVMFFIAVRDFLGRFRLPVYRLLLVIPFSCAVVALWAGYLLLGLDSYDAATAKLWFNNPPFNSHIRHSGYQVAAGISILFAFFAVGRRGPVSRAMLLPVLVVLCAFLLWMGGRGAVFSVVAAFGLLALILRVKRFSSRGLWLAFSVSLAVGLVLSEWLAVFAWNGVADLATRTLEAGNLKQLGTGRLGVWATAWDSVKDHLAFGLGPQGYWFMPNRIFGVQPHNLLVQFLVEWGVVGGLLFLGLLLYGFYYGFVAHIVRATENVDIASLSAGTMIVALTLHGLIDGTYYHPQPSLYLAIGFAIWTLPRRDTSLVADAS